MIQNLNLLKIILVLKRKYFFSNYMNNKNNVESKLKAEEKSYSQIQTSSSLLILSNLTLFLFLGDRKNFISNKTNISILYSAIILSGVCIFMNIIVLSVITKHIRYAYSFFSFSSKDKLLVKFHNYTVDKIDNVIKIFWLSIIFFMSSLYCFILYKFDLLNDNKYIWVFFTFLFTICFFILLISDIQDKNFFKKQKIKYSKMDII